jgi:arabinose-5-phosphate isomerase
MERNTIAKKVIEIESNSVLEQINHLDLNFYNAVSLIKKCIGHIVIIGIGKSGLIGRKISATMSSVGIPSIFLHPSECLHGDFGSILFNDIVIVISYSGNTEEIKKILLILKNMKIKVIAMTGKPKSSIWNNVDCIIDCSVTKEACPYNLVPTSSTTAMIVIGDALAINVSILKGFKREDLAKLHPFGSIGKKLTMQVIDFMRTGDNNPIVNQKDIVEFAISIMSKTKIGATSVVNDSGELIGFFTDGDLRRCIKFDKNLLKKKISFFMTKKPKVVNPEMIIIDAINIMKKNNIDNIPVINEKNEPIGILDQCDLLSSGLID